MLLAGMVPDNNLQLAGRVPDNNFILNLLGGGGDLLFSGIYNKKV